MNAKRKRMEVDDLDDVAVVCFSRRLLPNITSPTSHAQVTFAPHNDSDSPQPASTLSLIFRNAGTVIRRCFYAEAEALEFCRSWSQFEEILKHCSWRVYQSQSCPNAVVLTSFDSRS
jgi:hypothetical protein